MKRPGTIVTAVLAAVCALALVAGCAEKPATVELSGSDSGTAAQLAVGQELRISLDANPTTGYAWALDGALPAQLEQVGDPEYSADTGAIGSGGTEVWTFFARETGTATLGLKYWRSFEPTVPPVATFTVDLDVR